MNVSVVDVSASQKKLQVEIPAQKVQRELENRYKDLAKRVKLKGFRPGKVPMNILKSYYGKSVESELSNRFIQESFPEALQQADLKPLTEADVDEMRFEDSGAFTYVATVDVCPPFQVEGYTGLELKRPAVEIREEQVTAELDRLREQRAQLRTVEDDRAAREGDTLVVDFTPMVDDAVFDRGQTKDFMLEIGKKSLHPDFDQHLIGHRPGEIVSFELDYPEDAPTREIAGKRVRFEVTIKEFKEKVLPELDDAFAQQFGQGKTLGDLEEEIRDRLRKRAEDTATMEVRQQIIDHLVDKVELELSPKVVEKEVDRLIEMFQRQFESQGLKLDPERFNTPEIRAEYRPQAVKNVRWRLIVQRIAQQEGIEVTDEEVEEIYGEVARLLRTDVDRVREEYAQSVIVEQSKENRIQDKVFHLLEEKAVYTEIPAAEESQAQE